jgi:hypothetical protein
VNQVTQVALPSDFDVALIADGSRLPADALAALRELAWRKAESDPIWFIAKFWHIINVDTFQYQLFNLRDYQVEDARWISEAMQEKRRRMAVLKARQIGWTTLGTALAFHDLYFHRNHPWLLASQGEEEAQDTLANKVKIPYQMLPLWMRERGPALLDGNTERMTFANGSSILSLPATAKAGRSKAVYGALLDEFAFVEAADGLIGALDPLTYGPLIVFSTANGMGNRFHSLWLESQRPDSEWSGRFRPWHVVPERDQKWYEREFRKYRGQEWLFYQEYPNTPEEAFAKSGRTVMPMDLLRSDMCWCEPSYRIDLAKVDFTRPFDPTVADLEADAFADNILEVWEPPHVERDEKGRMVRKPNYVVSSDVAEGLEHGDRSSVWVYNANTMEQVATYLGHWPVEDLGELLEWLGYGYHTALMVVERNNHGILPLEHLRRSRYPRLYRPDQPASQSRDRTPRYGYLTTKQTKPKMVNDFVKAIRDGSVLLHDAKFLVEAQTFIADGKGGYSAAEGNHDDHVMGACIGLQGCLDAGRFPVVYFDDEVRPLRWSDILQLGVPRRPPSGLSQRIGPAPEAEAAVKSFLI